MDAVLLWPWVSLNTTHQKPDNALAGTVEAVSLRKLVLMPIGFSGCNRENAENEPRSFCTILPSECLITNDTFFLRKGKPEMV